MGVKNKTPKNPYRTYEATHTGTTMNLQIVLNTQKIPYLNQVTQENTCQIFRPTHPPPHPPPKKKNQELKISNPKNPSIIPVT